MGIFRNLFKKRSGGPPSDPTDPRWYAPFLFSQPTSGGVMVNPETALTHPVVYSCVKVISETMAAMPLLLYKRIGDRQKERATTHDLFKLLKSLPNPRMTAFEFKEMLCGHLLLRGNAYAQIILSNDGTVNSLYPLHPARMEVIPELNNNGEPTGEIAYKYRTGNGREIVFEANEILHIRGPSDGGLVGRTPLDCFREAIGQGLSMDQYVASFYGNSASPSGILTLPAGQSLSPKAKDRLRDDWRKKFSGVYRAGNIAVLEDGVTWTQVGMTSTDAQFIETEKMNNLDIARVFRMPPHKIGIMDGAKYNSIEHQSIEFYTDTMLPHLTRWEQAIERDLLSEKERNKFFVEFLVQSVLRGDLITRYKAYSIGRQWGWLSANDCRGFENENPIEGGDTYLQPLNMIEASQAMDYLMKESEPGGEPDVKLDGEDPSDPTLTNAKNLPNIMHRLLSQIVDDRNSSLLIEMKRSRATLEHRLGLVEDVVRANKIDAKMLQMEAKSTESSEKTPEIPENVRKIDEKQVDFIGTSFGAVRAAGVEVFAETIGRYVRKEIKDRQNAEKKGKLDTFDQDFFPKQKEQLAESLRPQIKFYLEQVRFFARDSARAVLPEFEVPESVDSLCTEFCNRYSEKFKGAEDADAASRNMASLLVGMIEECGAPAKRASFLEKKGKPLNLENVTATVKRDDQGNKVYFLELKNKEVATGG